LPKKLSLCTLRELLPISLKEFPKLNPKRGLLGDLAVGNEKESKIRPRGDLKAAAFKQPKIFLKPPEATASFFAVVGTERMVELSAAVPKRDSVKSHSFFKPSHVKPLLLEPKGIDVARKSGGASFS
jgi:hypothetical protein